jgi:hypothetical protein
MFCISLFALKLISLPPFSLRSTLSIRKVSPKTERIRWLVLELVRLVLFCLSGKQRARCAKLAHQLLDIERGTVQGGGSGEVEGENFAVELAQLCFVGGQGFVHSAVIGALLAGKRGDTAAAQFTTTLHQRGPLRLQPFLLLANLACQFDLDGRASLCAFAGSLWFIWVLAVPVVLRTLPALSSVVQSDNTQFLPADSPSQQAAQLAAPFEGTNPSSTAIIVVARTSGPLTPADDETIAQVEQAAARVPGVTLVRDQGTSKDPRVAQ